MPRLNVTSVTASGNVEALKSFSAGTGFRLPQYTSGNRPASAPAVGVMIYRSDTDIIEVWDGSAWQSIVSDAEIQSYANDAGRPVSPEIGKLGFNLDTGALEVYNGIDSGTNQPIWLTMGGATVEASGGNNTYTFNGYTIHAFTSDGTFTVTKGGDLKFFSSVVEVQVVTTTLLAEVLVVLYLRLLLLPLVLIQSILAAAVESLVVRHRVRMDKQQLVSVKPL